MSKGSKTKDLDAANAAALDPSRCPLCGQANQCQLCTTVAYKGPCWCAKIEMPAELLARVPLDLRNKACICPDCVLGFKRASTETFKVLPGDFYFDAGQMVFTAAYLLRRGYCCGNGCRHCPYPSANPREARA